MTIGSATTTTKTEQHLAGLTEREIGDRAEQRAKSRERGERSSAVTREWQQHEKQLNNKKVAQNFIKPNSPTHTHTQRIHTQAHTHSHTRTRSHMRTTQTTCRFCPTGSGRAVLAPLLGETNF